MGLGTGSPVNRKVIFRVFDAPTAGNRLWSEQHTVTISNGEFSVLLGNGIDAVFNGATETPLKSTTPFDAVFTSTGSADLSGAAATTKLVVQGDDSNAVPLQLNIRGNTDTNKRLLLGYNTTNNYASLQSYSTASGIAPVAINPVGGNVGIGTGNPGSLLSLNSPATNGAGISLTSDTYSSVINQKSFSTGDRALQFQNGSATGDEQAFNFMNSASNPVLSMLASGKVGIGIGTPAFPLSFGSGLGDKIALWGSSGNHYGIGIQNSVIQIHSDAAGADIAFGHGTSASMTETMRISGIGNLSVKGNDPSIIVGAPSGTLGALYFGNGSHGVKRNYYTGNNVGLYTTAADLYLSSNGPGVISNFVLKNNGYVGIGNTNPAVRLDVTGATYFTMADTND